MNSLEEIKALIEAAVAGAQLEIVENPSPSAQHSLVVDPAHALAVATFLRDEAALQLDYCSNVTGVDWPGKARVEGGETAGYLEVVYHLYSMALGHGPLILRQRTANRGDQVTVASLTPVWRSAEFQEREIFDLFGVVFEGHPDLRRILMWDEFTDHPMRRDYVEPDDFEYEPTAHDEILKRAGEHRAGLAAGEGAAQ